MGVPRATEGNEGDYIVAVSEGRSDERTGTMGFEPRSLTPFAP
jgi:hypothetical protein